MEKSEIGTNIDKLVIILDTNILLYLYKCSFNASQNIVELFSKVKEKVVIPSRVYKEYLVHKDEEQAKIDRKYDSFTRDLKKQGKGQILRSTPNTAPLICGAYNTQPEGLLTMA